MHLVCTLLIRSLLVWLFKVPLSVTKVRSVPGAASSSKMSMTSLNSGKKKPYTALLQCRTFLCRKKWGPQRKDCGGGYGFPGFYRVFVSTTGLESFSLRPEKFSKRFSFCGGCVRFLLLCKLANDFELSAAHIGTCSVFLQSLPGNLMAIFASAPQV